MLQLLNASFEAILDSFPFNVVIITNFVWSFLLYLSLYLVNIKMQDVKKDDTRQEHKINKHLAPQKNLLNLGIALRCGAGGVLRISR